MARLGTPQLRRVEIRYCSNDRGSTGVRAFLASKSFRNFKEKNPHIEVALKHRRGSLSVLYGYYRAGKVDRKGGVTPYALSLHNLRKGEVFSKLKYLHNRTGTGGRSFTRVKQTPTPTVQGFWHPDLDLGSMKSAFEALDLAALESAKKPKEIPAKV